MGVAGCAEVPFKRYRARNIQVFHGCFKVAKGLHRTTGAASYDMSLFKGTGIHYEAWSQCWVSYIYIYRRQSEP